MFLAIGVAALVVSDTIQRRIAAGDSHEKFEAFVQKVESGKWQLTTDKWLEGMRLQQATAEANLKADVALRELMLCLAGASLLGIIFQVFVMLHASKRLPNN